MEEELINLKMTSKQMVMASKKCEKNHKKQLKDVQKAIKQGNKEGAQIYAQNAIREKNQGMNYLRLSSRIDGVAARLETAIRTKEVRRGNHVRATDYKRPHLRAALYRPVLPGIRFRNR